MTAAGTRDAYLGTAPLRPGDTVRFVSPSGPGKPESLARAVAYYEAWGLNVVVGDHVLQPHPRAAYLAGPDDRRRQDLVDAWSDPDTDAVVCIRGGYGAMRLLDDIEWAAMRETSARRDGRPKLITGSSDITALHEAFRVHLDVPTLFCPMPGNDVFRDSEKIREDIHRWLFEPWGGRSIVGPATEALAEGEATGLFTGGNLSLLAASQGAPESVENPGGILFLEDIDEDLYRLDGFLLQLRRAGRLTDVSGIVLGSWHGCADLTGVRALMQEYLADLGVPVLWEQGFGHDPNALSVPLNVRGTMHASFGGGDHGVALTVDGATS